MDKRSTIFTRFLTVLMAIRIYGVTGPLRRLKPTALAFGLHFHIFVWRLSDYHFLLAGYIFAF